VKQLEKDLPDLLTFFDFAQLLWKKLHATKVLECCFVEVRRRTRPMVCSVNVASVDGILRAIFNGLMFVPHYQRNTKDAFALFLMPEPELCSVDELTLHFLH